MNGDGNKKKKLKFFYYDFLYLFCSLFSFFFFIYQNFFFISRSFECNNNDIINLDFHFKLIRISLVVWLLQYPHHLNQIVTNEMCCQSLALSTGSLSHLQFACDHSWIAIDFLYTHETICFRMISPLVNISHLDFRLAYLVHYCVSLLDYEVVK